MSNDFLKIIPCRENKTEFYLPLKPLTANWLFFDKATLIVRPIMESTATLPGIG